MTGRLRPESHPLLSPAHLQSLRSAGVHCGVDVVASDLDVLASRCSLTFLELALLRKGVLKAVDEPLSGASLYKSLYSSAILKTGCPDLDRLLGGGVYTGEVSEFCGATLSGKTRACLRLAAETAVAGKSALFVTSSSVAVNVACLAEMLTERTKKLTRDLRPEMERVSFVATHDCFSLLETLGRIRSALEDVRTRPQQREQHQSFQGPLVTDRPEQPSLLIVDSLAFVMSTLLAGPECHQGLGYLASIGLELKTLAADFNLAVVVVNHLVGGRSGEAGDRERPALGIGWASCPRVRVVLRSKKSSELEMVDSSRPGLVTLAELTKHSRLPCGKTKLVSI